MVCFQHRYSSVLTMLCGIASFLLYSGSSALAQQIERGTFSGGTGSTSGETYRMHGTVSESVAGRTSGWSPEHAYARFGLWHRPITPIGSTIVSLPERSSHVGALLTIPVELESVDGLIAGSRRDFTIQIRYNASLLDPLSTNLNCRRTGDSCYLELSGSAVLTPGTIAEIEFRATLGSDTATPLEIVAFDWVEVGEEVIQTTRKDGFFSLLGVCIEGDSVRLIRSSPEGARVAVLPNPIRTTTHITFEAVEAGETTFHLVDITGAEVARIARIDAVPEKLYDITAELHGVASGAYMLVCQTPSQRITERILVIE